MRNKRLELFISPITFAEVEEVLFRSNIINRIPYSSQEQIEFFLKSIVDNATIIHHIPKKFDFERDPKDEPYINLAIAANAVYIISRDKDLLDLMTGYTDECKEFRQKFRLLKAIEPLEFLKEIEKNNPIT